MDLDEARVIAEGVLRLRSVVEDEATLRLVATYYGGDDGGASAGGFAGYSFLELGNNLPYQLTSEDLLAVTLLDVHVRPAALRALRDSPEYVSKITAHLAAIPVDLPIWEAQDAVFDELNEFWELPGISPSSTT